MGFLRKIHQHQKEPVVATKKPSKKPKKPAKPAKQKDDMPVGGKMPMKGKC